MTVAVAVEVVAVAPTREAMDEEDYTLFLSHTHNSCVLSVRTRWEDGV